MRVSVRNHLASTRPTRANLVAALFAVITGILVAFLGLAPDGDEVETVEAVTAVRTLSAQSDPAVADSTTTTEPEGGPVEYETAMGDLAVHDATGPDQAVLSSGPEEPASPTTEPPTTTEPPATQPLITAASTTTIIEDTLAPTEAEGGEGETPTDSTDTTVEGEDPAAAPPAEGDTTTTTAAEGGETTEAPTTTTEAPPATDHPDGFVDAGHGVFVPPILIEIRRCESTHNYQAANPSSSARGAYQFLKSSWAAYGHADRYGVSEAHFATNAQQDEAALITWQRDGTRPWNASRSCWG